MSVHLGPTGGKRHPFEPRGVTTPRRISATIAGCAKGADLRLDEFHPSLAGTDLWVTTVAKALTS